MLMVQGKALSLAAVKDAEPDPGWACAHVLSAGLTRAETASGNNPVGRPYEVAGESSTRI